MFNVGLTLKVSNCFPVSDEDAVTVSGERARGRDSTHSVSRAEMVKFPLPQ